MLYELVNPSDPYVFEADSFPVAVATAWLISPMYAAKPEEGDDYFGCAEKIACLLEAQRLSL